MDDVEHSVPKVESPISELSTYPSDPPEDDKSVVWLSDDHEERPSRGNSGYGKRRGEVVSILDKTRQSKVS
jgi:hypothetical protein